METLQPQKIGQRSQRPPVGALIQLLLAAALSSCCASPWTAFPRSSPPDTQFSTGGGTHGNDVYVWECHGSDTERTVVFQYSAEMTCRAPERQTAPCGTPTAFETSLGAETRAPIRSGFEWKP